MTYSEPQETYTEDPRITEKDGWVIEYEPNGEIVGIFPKGEVKESFAYIVR